MPDRMLFPPSYYGSELTPDEEAEHELLQELEPDCLTCCDVGTVNGRPCVDCSTDE